MTRTYFKFDDGVDGSTYVINTPANTTSVPIADSTTGKFHYLRGLKVLASGTYQYVQYNLPAAKTDFACVWYINTDTAATGDIADFRAVNGIGSTTSTTYIELRRQGTNRFRLVDSAGTTLWTATSALAINTLIRCEIRIVASATAGQSKMTFSYFTGDSTTAVETYNATLTTLCTTPVQFDNIRLGKQTSVVQSPSTVVTYYDDFGYEDAPATAGNYPMGPVPSSSAVAYAGADKTVEAFQGWVNGDANIARANLDGSQSAYAGGTPTVAWSGPAGVTFTSPSSFTTVCKLPNAFVDTNYTITLTVTVGTAVSTDSVVVTVKAAERGYISGGQWKPAIKYFL